MIASRTRPHHRSAVVNGFVIGAMLLGWVVIGVAAQRMGYSVWVAVSAMACLIALVFFAVFTWNVLAALFGWKAVQPFVRWSPPDLIRRWLPLACLVVGLLFGHLFWH